MDTQNMPLQAVILVGGQGTRLQPLTFYLPKPMVPILNRPFMEHTLTLLKQANIGEIVLALSYLPDAIRDYFGSGESLRINLKYAMEKEPRGTAGAVKNAAEYLNHTFFVFNGDVFTDINLSDMLAFHRNKKAKVTIALTWVDDPSAFGVVETNTDNRVLRFIEKPPPGTATTNWINAGIYIIEPDMLNHIPPQTHYMFEKGLFPKLLEMGEPVYGYPFRGYWLDMGTVSKYLRLNNDLLTRVTRSPLVPVNNDGAICCGHSAAVHSSARLTGPVIIGDSCRIEADVVITGPAVIGANSCIGTGASVEKAVVWGDVHVGAGVRLEQCVIAGGVKIGDNNRITGQVITVEHYDAIK